jgi:hypothetical protein
VVLFAAYVLLCALRRISLHDSELAQARRCGSPSPGWRIFLHNHAPDIAAMDLFVAPTIGFDLLYFDWSAETLSGSTSHHIRPRNGSHGAAVTHRLRAMGIRDKPIAPGSPWQNGFAERLIGSIRRRQNAEPFALQQPNRAVRSALELLAQPTAPDRQQLAILGSIECHRCFRAFNGLVAEDNVHGTTPGTGRIPARSSREPL